MPPKKRSTIKAEIRELKGYAHNHRMEVNAITERVNKLEAMMKEVNTKQEKCEKYQDASIKEFKSLKVENMSGKRQMYKQNIVLSGNGVPKGRENIGKEKKIAHDCIFDAFEIPIGPDISQAHYQPNRSIICTINKRDQNSAFAKVLKLSNDPAWKLNKRKKIFVHLKLSPEDSLLKWAAKRLKSKDYGLIKDWEVNATSGKVTVTKLDGKKKSLNSEDDMFKFMSKESKVRLIKENRKFLKEKNPNGLKLGNGHLEEIDL